MKKYIFFFFILLTTHVFSQTWKVYNTTNSAIPSDAVTGLAVASDGKIWISTISGIASFDTLWHKHVINNSSYSYDEILNIWCRNNLVWLGTESRGLFSFNGVSTWKDYDSGSAGNGIVGFGIDNKDTIWRLDKFGWFSKWTGTQWNDIITFIDHPNSLFVDKNGSKWIISGNQGLIKFDNGIKTTFNSIPDASLYCMVQDSKGNYWIGGDNNGLLKFDGINFTFFNTQNSSICSNRIRAIAIDDDDVLWIGSWDGGLSKFDGTKWNTFNTKNSPLSSNLINSIVVDKNRKIWIANGYNEFMSPSGGKGIIVLDPMGDINTTAIENIQSNINVDIFPNPVSDNLIIRNHDLRQVIDIEMFDIDGRSVHSLKSAGNQSVLNLSGLSNGIYLLKVKWDKSILIKKIIKK